MQQTLVFLVLRRLKQKDREFETRLGYISRPCFQKKVYADGVTPIIKCYEINNAVWEDEGIV
jgi:hypothetical protein